MSKSTPQKKVSIEEYDKLLRSSERANNEPLAAFLELNPDLLPNLLQEAYTRVTSALKQPIPDQKQISSNTSMFQKILEVAESQDVKISPERNQKIRQRMERDIISEAETGSKMTKDHPLKTMAIAFLNQHGSHDALIIPEPVKQKAIEAVSHMTSRPSSPTSALAQKPIIAKKPQVRPH